MNWWDNYLINQSDVQTEQFVRYTILSKFCQRTKVTKNITKFSVCKIIELNVTIQSSHNMNVMWLFLVILVIF